MALPENVKLWYREFLGIMIRKGYDVYDPMSNYAIRGFRLERSSKFYDSSNCKSFFAGCPTNENGDYKYPPENGIVDMKWMNDNFKAPANFDEATIKKLYKLSSEGRLSFNEKDCLGEHKKLLYVDVNGSPRLSENVDKIPPFANLIEAARNNEMEGVALPPLPNYPGQPREGSPDYDNQVKRLNRYTKATMQWEEDTEKLLKPIYEKQVRSFLPDCPDSAKFANSITVFDREDRQYFTSEWYTEDEAEKQLKSREWEDTFFVDYHSNPEYYKDPTERAARIHALEETFRDPENENLPCHDSEDHSVIKAWIATTGMSVKQLCDNKMITHADGTPFVYGKYDWETIDAIDTEIRYKEQAVKLYDHLENGVPTGAHTLSYRDKVRTDVPFVAKPKLELDKPFVPQNMVADITDAQTEKAGAFMSSRQRMAVKMEDGSTVKGYFTSTSTADYQKDFQNVINDMIEDYKELGVDEGLKVIPFLEHLRDNYDYKRFCNLAKEMAGSTDSRKVISRSPFALESSKYKTISLIREIGLDLDYAIEQVTTNLPIFAQTTNKLVEEVISLPDIKYTNEAAGVFSGVNINRRNNAMTGMAELMGEGDIIARSVNMTVKDGDKTKTGTFMLNAKGLHESKIDPLQPGFGQKKMTISTKAFIEMNKLQILDYLCANVDRHAANFMYQFDTSDSKEVKLVGVQGFDNDLSFGVIDHRNEVQIRRMSCIKDINVIDKNLATKVLAMKPNDVEHMLRSNGLNDDEITMAKLRLTDLQNHIASGTPKIVSGDEWNNISLKTLNIHEESYNIYANVFYEMEAYNKIKLPKYLGAYLKYEHANRKVLKPEKELSASSSVTECTTSQLTAQSERLKEIRDSFIKTNVNDNTGEFDKMYNSLGKLITLTDTLAKKENGLTDKDYNTLADAFENTRRLSKEYIGKKDAVPFTSRGKQRLSLAKNLEAYCKDERHTVLEESVAAMNVRLKTSLPDYRSIGQIESELRLGQKATPERFAEQIHTLNTVAETRKTDMNLVSICGNLTDRLIQSVGKDEDFINKSGLTKEDLLKATKTIAAGKNAENKLNPKFVNPVKEENLIV